MATEKFSTIPKFFMFLPEIIKHLSKFANTFFKKKLNIFSRLKINLPKLAEKIKFRDFIKTV